MLRYVREALGEAFRPKNHRMQLGLPDGAGLPPEDAFAGSFIGDSISEQKSAPVPPVGNSSGRFFKLDSARLHGLTRSQARAERSQTLARLPCAAPAEARRLDFHACLLRAVSCFCVCGYL